MNRTRHANFWMRIKNRLLQEEKPNIYIIKDQVLEEMIADGSCEEKPYNMCFACDEAQNKAVSEEIEDAVEAFFSQNVEKAKQIKSPKELLAFAKENGIELTEEEIAVVADSKIRVVSGEVLYRSYHYVLRVNIQSINSVLRIDIRNHLIALIVNDV